MSLGVDLDEDGNVEGSIISEDWGGMFSQAELDQLSPKQRKLYQKLKKELSKNENMERLYRGENLAAISATAKKLLR